MNKAMSATENAAAEIILAAEPGLELGILPANLRPGLARLLLLHPAPLGIAGSPAPTGT